MLFAALAVPRLDIARTAADALDRGPDAAQMIPHQREEAVATARKVGAVFGYAGALLGPTLRALGAVGARDVYQVPASIPAWAVVLSLASASGAGLLFGIHPTVRASRLDPVEAMRTE